MFELQVEVIDLFLAVIGAASGGDAAARFPQCSRLSWDPTAGGSVKRRSIVMIERLAASLAQVRHDHGV
jgi:hypothetical protein